MTVWLASSVAGSVCSSPFLISLNAPGPAAYIESFRKFSFFLFHPVSLGSFRFVNMGHIFILSVRFIYVLTNLLFLLVNIISCCRVMRFLCRHRQWCCSHFLFSWKLLLIWIKFFNYLLTASFYKYGEQYSIEYSNRWFFLLPQFIMVYNVSV